MDVRHHVQANYCPGRATWRTGKKYYNDVYDSHCPHLHHRLSYCRGAHIWRATNFESNPDIYKNYHLGRDSRHPCRRRAGFYHVTHYRERVRYKGQRLDYHVRMRRARQRHSAASRVRRHISWSNQRAARGDVLDDEQRWRWTHIERPARLRPALPGGATPSESCILVADDG